MGRAAFLLIRGLSIKPDGIMFLNPIHHPPHHSHTGIKKTRRLPCLYDTKTNGTTTAIEQQPTPTKPALWRVWQALHIVFAVFLLL